jgi:hypothetical protein
MVAIMQQITKEEFSKGLDLLSSVHGSDYPVFNNAVITQIWLEFFQARCTTSKFFKMIRHHLQVCPFFPKVPNDILKVWQESGDERTPGENWLETQQELFLSLPSQEAADKAREMEELNNLSPEQMAENKKRAALLYLIVKNLRSISSEEKEQKIQYLTTAPLHELEAIAKTCDRAKQLAVVGDRYGNLKPSPNALFEDMHKYFHSGSDKYRQVAINWASDPRNGCDLVRKNGEVVDISQVDF